MGVGVRGRKIFENELRGVSEGFDWPEDETKLVVTGRGESGGIGENTAVWSKDGDGVGGRGETEWSPRFRILQGRFSILTGTRFRTGEDEDLEGEGRISELWVLRVTTQGIHVVLDLMLGSSGVLDRMLDSPGVYDRILGSPGVLDRMLGSSGVLDRMLDSPGVLDRMLVSPGVLDRMLGSSGEVLRPKLEGVTGRTNCPWPSTKEVDGPYFGELYVGELPAEIGAGESWS